MKRIFLVLAVITAFASCKSGDSGTPTAAVDGMFTAMKNGNIAEMKKFIAKSDVALIETAENLVKSINPEGLKKAQEEMAAEFKEKVKDVTYKIKNEKVDGDNATVDVDVSGGPADSVKNKTHTLNLVKEDGTWKVALTKSGDMFNSMKGDMGPNNEPDKKDFEEGVEKLKNMHPDSLKALVNKGLEAMDSLRARKKN